MRHIGKTDVLLRGFLAAAVKNPPPLREAEYKLGSTELVAPPDYLPKQILPVLSPLLVRAYQNL